MADGTGDKASAEALRDEVERLRADMAAIAQTLKSMGAEGGSKVYERVREKASRAKGEAEEVASNVGRRIEERPLIAVLIALFIGAILGALMSRR